MLKSQQKKLPRKGAVKVIDGREICNTETSEGRRIYGQRCEDMCLRQGMACAICRKWSKVLYFDHEAGRGSGGGHRTDAILDAEGHWINAALCYDCNSIKGSKRYKWVNGAYKPVDKYKEKAA